MARSAAIGESVPATPASPAEPGSRWIVDPNGDAVPGGRQLNDGSPRSARLSLSVVPVRFTAAMRDVSDVGSASDGTSDMSWYGSQEPSTTRAPIERPSARTTPLAAPPSTVTD